LTKKQKRRWKGTPGKPFDNARWISRSENIRTSFRLQPRKDDYCDKIKEYSPKREPLGRGRKRQFSPLQEYNYKSRYARYLRSLEISPSQIVELENGCVVYRFYSCSSPTSFWEVQVCPLDEDLFLRVGRSLTIICIPAEGYQLDSVESNAEDGRFTWEQITGNRSVFLDPPKNKNPRLFIQNVCLGSGCSDGSFLPILLQVSIDGTNLAETLVIYTTPTDTHFGIGSDTSIALPDASPCLKADTLFFAPVFDNKAFCYDGTQDLVITWKLPTCNQSYIIGTAITKNTTGSYELVQFFPIDTERIFAIQPNISYRIQTFYNINGRTFSTLGKPIQVNFINHTLFADEIQRGISSFLVTRFVRVELVFKRIIEEDNFGGIGTSSINDFARQSIAVKRIVEEEETRGLAVSFYYKFTRFNFGGIIIG
jgi:hypothetical protein